jgi:hypothetical protein
LGACSDTVSTNEQKQQQQQTVRMRRTMMTMMMILMMNGWWVGCFQDHDSAAKRPGSPFSAVTPVKKAKDREEVRWLCCQLIAW